MVKQDYESSMLQNFYKESNILLKECLELCGYNVKTLNNVISHKSMINHDN